MPKASIIVPVYNVENYLKKCIDSILIQEEKDFELILIDDGSNDNSGNICDEYANNDNRIKVIHNTNQGPSMARNAGLDICTGSYITFVDSDDYIEKDYLSKMIKKAEENNADVVICGFKQIFNHQIEIHTVKEEKKIDKNEYTEGLLIQRGYGLCRCKLYKKEIINNTRFKSELIVGEDTFFNLNISKKLEKCIYIKDVLYNYNVNPESLVRKYNKKYLENYLMSSIKTKEYIDNNYTDNNLRKLTNNYTAFTLTLVIVNYCCHPERNKRSFFKEALDIKKTCNIKEYKQAIKDVELKYLSKTRKIMIIALKMRLYIIASLMGHIRQLQMKGKNQ